MKFSILNQVEKQGQLILLDFVLPGIDGVFRLDHRGTNLEQALSLATSLQEFLSHLVSAGLDTIERESQAVSWDPYNGYSDYLRHPLCPAQFSRVNRHFVNALYPVPVTSDYGIRIKHENKWLYFFP